MIHSKWLVEALAVCTTAFAQRGVTSPLASLCHTNLSTVVCINKYAAVLPYPFDRTVSRNDTQLLQDSFQGTFVPKDPSFNLTKHASFLVFDQDRAIAILGPTPSYHYMFDVSPLIHEAPVYIPSQNKIIFAEFSYRSVPPLIIDLNKSPPTLSNYTTTPPVFGINGGRYYKGLVYWAVSGSKASNGTREAPGIVTLNPDTGEITTLLNNYFGTTFNSPNDLVIDSAGDVFFTDSVYGWQQSLTAAAPALPIAVYRFRPSTGAVNVIENGLVAPNGIGISPDEKTMYISDTGAEYSTIYLPSGVPIPPLGYNATGQRTVFSYDVRESPVGKFVVNRRPIYISEEGLPDGFHVARNGYLLTAAGRGSVFSFSFEKSEQH